MRVPVSVHLYQHWQWLDLSFANTVRGKFIFLLNSHWDLFLYIYQQFMFSHMNYLLMPFAHLSVRDLVLLIPVWASYTLHPSAHSTALDGGPQTAGGALSLQDFCGRQATPGQWVLEPLASRTPTHFPDSLTSLWISEVNRLVSLLWLNPWMQPCPHFHWQCPLRWLPFISSVATPALVWASCQSSSLSSSLRTSLSSKD